MSDQDLIGHIHTAISVCSIAALDRSDVDLAVPTRGFNSLTELSRRVEIYRECCEAHLAFMDADDEGENLQVIERMHRAREGYRAMEAERNGD